MADPRTHNKSFKSLTIIAIVLFVLIAVPYIVIAIARNAAEHAATRFVAGVRLQLSGVQFDTIDYVTLTFRPIPDSPPNFYSADWSLLQWKVISTTGVYPSYDGPVETVLGKGSAEGAFRGESNSLPPINWEFDAAKWETGHPQSEDVPPLKAERHNIDPGRP